MNPSSPSASSLWRNANFIRLFAAQIVSLLGSGVTTIGLALFAFSLSGGPGATAVLGNALTLRIVAFLLFSQPAGVLADRVNRKAVLVASDLLRAGLLLSLPFATTVWHVYVLIFVINAVTAFFSPTYEASVPAVVGPDHIVQALAVSRIAVDVEALMAPAVAALIVALVGARWVFWFDAMTYVVSAALVVASQVPSARVEATRLSIQSFAREITYGTRVILREPSLRQAILLSFVEATAGAAAIVGTVAYVKGVLGRGDNAVAVAMGAVGVGSSLAALLLGRATGRYEAGTKDRVDLHGRRHAWSRRAMMLGGIALGLVLLPGALVPPLALLVGLWMLNGAGQALIGIASSTLLAEHTRENERGRVYAAHFALTHACWLVTYPVIGNAAARWGTPVTFTTAGVVALCVAVFSAVTTRAPGAHAHSARNEPH